MYSAPDSQSFSDFTAEKFDYWLSFHIMEVRRQDEEYWPNVASGHILLKTR